MSYILGVVMVLVSVLGLKFFNFSISLAMLIGGIGFVLAVLSFVIPRKPKYKNRELTYEYKLLPIAENIYAIKKCDGKIICKYVNENNEAKIDAVDSYWKEIKEYETDEKASLKYYERKPKFCFSNLPFMESKIEVDIHIPKGTIIS